ncbi:MAG: CoA pyrophosphatase [Thiotrichales bacterium]|nr:CoA pyrophosphatase [Thiotrichales bacterium]
MNTLPDHAQASAAVALVITRDIPSVLLVRRADNPQDPWSGHWALPGGRIESGDEDLVATCQREVLEECGYALNPACYKRALPLSLAGRKHSNPVIVAPFLWEIPNAVELVPDNKEVICAQWQAIDYLRDPDNHASGKIAPKYADAEFPYIMVGNTPLWGFTYQVLMDYLESTGA